MLTTRTLKSAFRHSIRLGTGRAYLLARAHPEVDFSDAIIEASLKNFAYDGQAEPSRADYLYGLYQLAGQQARIRRAVLKGLATEQADTWTLTQLFGLALKLAQAGHAEARQAIYRRFLVRPIWGSDWAGADEIITLDGLEGLKYIARKVGRKLGRRPDGREDEMYISSFQEKYPELDAWTELRQLAGHDADVRRYLQNVEATMASRAEYLAQRPPEDPAPNLLNMMQKAQPAYIRSRLRRREIEPQELAVLAEVLLTEKRPQVLDNLLLTFGRFPFPLSYAPILAIARRRPHPGSHTQDLALDALALLPAPEIRAFALARLQHTSQPAAYTILLQHNYQPGDAALLTASVGRTHEEHAIEQLAVSYTDMYEANKTPECAGPLLALYEKMTCGLHRNEVVKLLIANDVLPAWLNEELPFDSNAETQALHQSPQ
jgi:hypothetical protein